jgi:hypothetical protein
MILLFDLGAQALAACSAIAGITEHFETRQLFKLDSLTG